MEIGLAAYDKRGDLPLSPHKAALKCKVAIGAADSDRLPCDHVRITGEDTASGYLRSGQLKRRGGLITMPGIGWPAYGHPLQSPCGFCVLKCLQRRECLQSAPGTTVVLVANRPHGANEPPVVQGVSQVVLGDYPAPVQTRIRLALASSTATSRGPGLGRWDFRYD